MANRLGKRIQTEKLKVAAFSTTWSTFLQCRQFDFPLLNFSEASLLGIASNSDNKIDLNKNLITDRRAALLQKSVASIADDDIIIANSGKKVKKVREKFAALLELLPDANSPITHKISELENTLTAHMERNSEDSPTIPKNLREPLKMA